VNQKLEILASFLKGLIMEEQSREDNKSVEDTSSAPAPRDTPHRVPDGTAGSASEPPTGSNAVSQDAAKAEPGDSKSPPRKKRTTICGLSVTALIVALVIVGYLFVRTRDSGVGTKDSTNEAPAISNGVQAASNEPQGTGTEPPAASTEPSAASNQPSATSNEPQATSEKSGLWLSNQMIAVYIAIGVVAAGVGVWLFLRRTFRTRLKMQKEMKLDPDVTDWLIIFNWTPKILYTPTIIASLIASLIMYLNEADLWIFSSIPPVVIGGIWLAIFFLNFLVEEFSMSIKVLIITLASVGCFLLWLNLLGWVMGFLRLFKYLALSVNATGYLLVGIIGLFTILVSWIKGLFYYLAITPNYMNIQEGPTESGEQIGREDYNSRIDTSDFLERLMGFGKIVITFKDKKREPISVLTWRIQKKSQMLERVRGKFAIDYPQQTQIKV
jgi:hypothetical protein